MAIQPTFRFCWERSCSIPPQPRRSCGTASRHGISVCVSGSVRMQVASGAWPRVLPRRDHCRERPRWPPLRVPSPKTNRALTSPYRTRMSVKPLRQTNNEMTVHVATPVENAISGQILATYLALGTCIDLAIEVPPGPILQSRLSLSTQQHERLSRDDFREQYSKSLKIWASSQGSLSVATYWRPTCTNRSRFGCEWIGVMGTSTALSAASARWSMGLTGQSALE
jgi:hypothetical protein